MRLFAVILFASAVVCSAAESGAGRWEGIAQIRGSKGRRLFNMGDSISTRIERLLNPFPAVAASHF